MSDIKRLFFGFEVYAPWPDDLPDARTLKAKHRHLTIAFLGDTSYKQIRSLIPKMPKPSFRVGPVALSDACLCLPQRDPRVVTWHGSPLWSRYHCRLSKRGGPLFIGGGVPHR